MKVCIFDILLSITANIDIWCRDTHDNAHVDDIGKDIEEETVVSLIEEALRKQREENDKPGNIPPPIPPIPNHSLPDPSLENSIPEVPTRRPWVLLAGIAGIGVIAILFVVWMLVFGLKLWQSKPAALNIIKTVVITNTPTIPVISPPITHTNDSTKQQPLPLSGHSATSTPTIIAVPPQTHIPTPLPSPEQPISPAPPQVTPLQITSSPPPSITKLELPVVWPKLMVSGIIGSAKSGRSAAILNGQMLSLGDALEGVTVESIEKQKVKLRYRGEVKILSVGASTE